MVKTHQNILQLADRSTRTPKCVVEDAVIKVGEFIFPMDFVVLETEFVVNPKAQIPVILGQPFPATSNTLINCRAGMMKLSFENMTIDLNIFHLQRQPTIFYDVDSVNWLICMLVMTHMLMV